MMAQGRQSCSFSPLAFVKFVFTGCMMHDKARPGHKKYREAHSNETRPLENNLFYIISHMASTLKRRKISH